MIRGQYGFTPRVLLWSFRAYYPSQALSDPLTYVFVFVKKYLTFVLCHFFSKILHNTFGRSFILYWTDSKWAITINNIALIVNGKWKKAQKILNWSVLKSYLICKIKFWQLLSVFTGVFKQPFIFEHFCNFQ